MRLVALTVLLGALVLPADAQQDAPPNPKERARTVVVERRFQGDGTDVVTHDAGSVTVRRETHAEVNPIPPPIPVEREGRRDVLKKKDLVNKDGWT